MSIKRPSFDELKDIEKLSFGNGVGPDWLPDRFRQLITGTASWFFEEASWRHHDFGYVVGGDRWDRARCDWKFLIAMLYDAISQRRLQVLTIPIALLLAMVFYIMVRIFGQFGSFEYRDSYASLDEVRQAYCSALANQTAPISKNIK